MSYPTVGTNVIVDVSGITKNGEPLCRTPVAATVVAVAWDGCTVQFDTPLIGGVNVMTVPRERLLLVV